METTCNMDTKARYWHYSLLILPAMVFGML